MLGSSLNGAEMTLLETAKTAYPILNNATIIRDSDDALSDIGSGKYRFIVLVGGPAQNRITKYYNLNGNLNGTEQIIGQAVAQTGDIRNGALLIALSDKRGYDNAARESIMYSSLSALIPEQSVPIAATGISLFLLILINVGRTVFEFKALDIGRKGQKIGQGASYLFGANMTKIGALILASFVLGVSISWQYFGFSAQFLFWVFVNSIICMVAGIAHEITHRMLAHIFGIKVEYRF